MKKRISIFFFFFMTMFLQHVVFAQGVWTQKAAFPGTARADAFYFSIGTKGYIGGGEDVSNSYVNDFWEYNSLTNVWTQKSSFGGPARWQSVAFSIGTKGYVGTGEGNGSTFLGDFWEYDPATDVWTQKANFGGTARWDAVGFSIGNKGYIGTGRDPSSSALNDFWEYDPSTNGWTQKANVPVGRSYATAFSVGNKGYIGTGHDVLINFLGDFEAYDPATDTWTPTANFPGGGRDDVDGGHFTIGNYGYVGTGKAIVNSSWVYYNDFWKYNPVTDAWTAIPNMPALVRIGVIDFSINNSGYIGTGFYVTNNYIHLGDLWSFTDTTKTETGIHENQLQNSISIYPNPFSDHATINLSIAVQNATIVIYDISGKEIFRNKFSGNSTIIERNRMAKGTYSFTIMDENGNASSGKFIVQ